MSRDKLQVFEKSLSSSKHNNLLEVNLHSNRFSSVFVRVFTFLLLREQVCPFSSAFLYVHIRTNQTVTYWTKVFRKNFLLRGTALL